MIFSAGPARRISRAVLFLIAAAAIVPAASAAETTYHLLQKGETLYSVARSYGIKLEELAKANSIDDTAKIPAGMRLIIPASASDPQSGSTGEKPQATPITYKVVKGDTLFSIAKAYGIGLDDLRSINKLSASSIIKPGSILKIPAGGIAPKGDANKANDSPKAGDPTPAVPDAVRTSSKAVSAGLRWPCPGEILYLDGKAYGIVIRAKLGEVQKAVASGTVSSAGPYRGYGNVVFVLSRTGYIYVYGGNESLAVRAGDKVSSGQEIGRVGMDAKQGLPAAYFLVFKNGEAVDPAAAPRD